MIEGIGHHRFHDGDVVDDGRRVGQKLGQLGARLAVAGKRELGAKQRGAGVDESGPVLLDQFLGRQGSVEFGQLGLAIKQV